MSKIIAIVALLFSGVLFAQVTTHWICAADKDGVRKCYRSFQSECNTCTEYEGGGTMCTAMACPSYAPHAPENCQPKAGETKVCDQ